MSKKGTYYVKDLRSQRVFCVEVLDNHPHIDWGTYNTNQKNYTGSVTEKESIITPQNGFTNIETLPPGHNPIDYIESLLKRDLLPNQPLPELEVCFVEAKETKS